MRRIVVALLLLALLAGCTGLGESGTDTEAGTALDVQHVEARDTTHRDSGFSMTREDSQVRLEVYAGARQASGSTMSISEVRRVDDTIVVDATLDIPPDNPDLAQHFIYPADAVMFPLDRGAYRVRLHLTEAGNTTTMERTVVLH